MNRLSSRQLISLLFGVFLALGMSLSVVQASGMASKMAMTSGMADSGNGNCADYGGDDGNTNPVACKAMCTAGYSPAVLSFGALFANQSATVPPVPHEPPSRGWVASPDPYPPRSIDLG